MKELVQGPWPDQRHHAGDGLDDRLRHLYCVGGNRPRSRFARAADWRLAVAGFMTIVAALSYGELAAMMPQAGGQYVYLREALGPLWGFLYGWTLFLVIQTGTIAAVGVAFGKFLGVFFPVDLFFQLDSAFLESSADPSSARWFWATWMSASTRKILSPSCW